MKKTALFILLCLCATAAQAQHSATYYMRQAFDSFMSCDMPKFTTGDSIESRYTSFDIKQEDGESTNTPTSLFKDVVASFNNCQSEAVSFSRKDNMISATFRDGQDSVMAFVLFWNNIDGKTIGVASYKRKPTRQDPATVPKPKTPSQFSRYVNNLYKMYTADDDDYNNAICAELLNVIRQCTKDSVKMKLWELEDIGAVIDSMQAKSIAKMAYAQTLMLGTAATLMDDVGEYSLLGIYKGKLILTPDGNKYKGRISDLFEEAGGIYMMGASIATRLYGDDGKNGAVIVFPDKPTKEEEKAMMAKVQNYGDSLEWYIGKEHSVMWKEDPAEGRVYKQGETDLPVTFAEGADKMDEYISEHLVYPDDARERGIRGRTTVSFVYDRKGYVKKITGIEGCIHPSITAEAVRLVLSMKWKPAVKDGKPVTSEYSVSMEFKPYVSQNWMQQARPYLQTTWRKDK